MPETDRLTLKIDSAFGADFLLHGLDGTEEMSSLFSFTLSCHSKRTDLNADTIVGKGVCFSVLRQDSSWRDFHGLVAAFAPMDDGSGQPLYRLSIVPWLWCLTQSSDFRIYQDKDVKEILKDVFQRHGFTDHDFSGLSGSYAKREYCVQYNETAFNFVSRLMEDEGIFYWFKHESSRHVLMLGDSPEAYQKAGDASVAFDKDPQAGGGDDLLISWHHEQSLTTGFFSATDYDYAKPDLKLEKKSDSVGSFEHMDKLEAYDYPAMRIEPGAVQTVVKHDTEMAAALGERVSGGGCCRTFSPGLTFTLENHPDSGERGKSFVLTQVSHAASGSRQLVGQNAGGSTYTNSFSCVPKELIVRPPRRTLVPFVKGVETALVTGPKGEEIHTDELGRIKIQFHWDRLGKSNEESSCWVRVSQPLAGNGWGAVALPRIGQEVIVSFVNGSPDRPLVIGALYNGLNAAPYGLPAEKTKTVFRTRSTPKGSAGNELTFDDKKGKEVIFLHGEHDLIVTINNDAKSTIDNEWHLTVKKDAFETIQGESKRTIEKSEDVAVTNDYKLKATTISLEGSTKITLKVGGSTLEMTPAGITVKAPKIDAKADALLTLDGGMVMIG